MEPLRRFVHKFRVPITLLLIAGFYSCNKPADKSSDGIFDSIPSVISNSSSVINVADTSASDLDTLDFAPPPPSPDLDSLITAHGKAGAYWRLGDYYRKQIADYETAMKYYQIADSLAQKIQDPQKRAEEMTNALNRMGATYHNQGNFDEALGYYFKSLKIYEDNNINSAFLLFNIGSVYKELSELENAELYFKKTLKIAGNFDSQIDSANGLNGLGNISLAKTQYEEALSYYSQALGIYQLLDNVEGTIVIYSNMAAVYSQQKKYDLFFQYTSKILEKQEKVGDKKGMVINLFNIGVNYKDIKEHSQALVCFKKSLELSKEINDQFYEKENYLKIANEYSLLNDYESAYKYRLFYDDLQAELNTKEKNKQIAELNTKYQTEQKEQKIKLQETENRQITLEARNRLRMLWGVTGGLLITGLLAAYAVWQRRKSERAKKEVEVKNKELNEKNIEISQQKEIIEEKNKSITESIEYATNIQNALLPSHEKVSQVLLQEHFVLYQPRDIVSGDFYQVEEKDGKVLAAVADCTGHGVP